MKISDDEMLRRSLIAEPGGRWASPRICTTSFDAIEEIWAAQPGDCARTGGRISLNRRSAAAPAAARQARRCCGLHQSTDNIPAAEALRRLWPVSAIQCSEFSALGFCETLLSSTRKFLSFAFACAGSRVSAFLLPFGYAHGTFSSRSRTSNFAMRAQLSSEQHRSPRRDQAAWIAPMPMNVVSSDETRAVTFAQRIAK